MYISDLILICASLLIVVSVLSVDGSTTGMFAKWYCWQGSCNFTDCHKEKKKSVCPFGVEYCRKDVYPKLEVVNGQCGFVFIQCKPGKQGHFKRECCYTSACNFPGDLRKYRKASSSLSSLHSASNVVILINLLTSRSKQWKN